MADGKFEVLPGPSSVAYSRGSLLFFGGDLVFGAIALYLNFLGRDGQNQWAEPYFGVATGGVAVCVVGAVTFWALGQVKTRAQWAAGYTMLNDDPVEYALIDFPTRSVIRVAGEPKLEYAEYTRRARAARGATDVAQDPS